MGFMDFLTKIIQKFTPVDLGLERYTHKELIDMKNNGYKVDEVQKYIEMYEKGEHPKQIKKGIRLEKKRVKDLLYRLRFEELSELDIKLSEIPNPTDLYKIKPYLSININPDMEIIKKSLKGIRTNKKDFIDGQIALTSVVQSAPAFWEKSGEIGYAAFVFTYVKKGDYLNNSKFLKLISAMLINFRDEDSCPERVSNEMKKLYDDLNNSESQFHIHVDQSLLDYYEFHFEEKRVVTNDIIVATTFKTQSEKDKLPNTSFPSDGILPLICLSEKKKKGDNPYFGFVSGEYYSA